MKKQTKKKYVLILNCLHLKCVLLKLMSYFLKILNDILWEFHRIYKIILKSLQNHFENSACFLRVFRNSFFVRFLNSNALSLYKSQNVLCRSKFFEPAKKLDCIYCIFKNFCTGTKNNFAECKSSFCLAKNICDCHNM